MDNRKVKKSRPQLAYLTKLDVFCFLSQSIYICIYIYIDYRSIGTAVPARNVKEQRAHDTYSYTPCRKPTATLLERSTLIAEREKREGGGGEDVRIKKTRIQRREAKEPLGTQSEARREVERDPL